MFAIVIVFVIRLDKKENFNEKKVIVTNQDWFAQHSTLQMFPYFKR